MLNINAADRNTYSHICEIWSNERQQSATVRIVSDEFTKSGLQRVLRRSYPKWTVTTATLEPLTSYQVAIAA